MQEEKNVFTSLVNALSYHFNRIIGHPGRYEEKGVLTSNFIFMRSDQVQKRNPKFNFLISESQDKS